MGLLQSKNSMLYELDQRWSNVNGYIQKLNETKSLVDIFDLHKEIWKAGIRHSYFGPDYYGMFRTDDIATMEPSQVYLGDIEGIWTNNLPFFEAQKTSHPDVYKLICNQYRDHLVNNLKMLRAQIYDNGIGREKLGMNIVFATEKIREHNGTNDGRTFLTSSHFKVHDLIISENKILHCEFTYNNKTVQSSFVNISGRIFIPENFDKGVMITEENFNALKYYDVVNVLNDEDNALWPKKAFDLTDEVKINYSKASETTRQEVKNTLKRVNALETEKKMSFGFRR